MSTFLERLRELMGDRSAAAFARQCGVPASNVRSYLLGREPGLDNLTKIAEKSGVRLEWLMMGRGIKYQHDAQVVDVIEFIKEHFGGGPITKARMFQIFVMQVSNIQDPSLRQEALNGLLEAEKSLGLAPPEETPAQPKARNKKASK